MSYHIWVVPVPGAGVLYDGVLVVPVVVDHARHRLPAVLDVVKVAPQVARLDDRVVVGLNKTKNIYVRHIGSCCESDRTARRKSSNGSLSIHFALYVIVMTDKIRN